MVKSRENVSWEPPIAVQNRLLFLKEAKIHQLERHKYFGQGGIEAQGMGVAGVVIFFFFALAVL